MTRRRAPSPLAPTMVTMGFISQGKGSLAQRDAAIWQTIQIDHALRNQQLHLVPRQPSTVRMPDGGGSLASGPFETKRWDEIRLEARQVDMHRTGMYNHVSFSNSKAIRRSIGYQMTTAMAAGALNRRNERKANAKSGWQWVDDDRGEVHFCSTSFVLRGQAGTQEVPWGTITNATLDAVNALTFEIGSRGRTLRYALNSPFAELAFVMWAHHEFPQHADLLSRRWIPAGWHQRMIAQGIQLPVGS